MITQTTNQSRKSLFQRGSILVIVLWIAFGLVSITLYFANSMSFELRVADNKVCAVAAEQAIEGAARYAGYVLLNLGTNGMIPYWDEYYRDEVPIGDSHFWFIGRDYNVQPGIRKSVNEPFFCLVDEASKLNLNTVTTNMLELLPRMTYELADNIVQWRTSNSANAQLYAMLHPPYSSKGTNFETTEEMRLVYGATLDILVGEDANRNGVLDPDEYDENRNSEVDPGLLEYFTVFTREPNTRSDGTARINISSGSLQQLSSLLQTNLTAERANAVISRLGGGGGGGRGGGGVAQQLSFRSPLQLYRRSGMTMDEFALISKSITASAGTYITGRVNIATASPAVLYCLPGMGVDLVQQIVSYRETHWDTLTNSVAWIVEALGDNNTEALDTLAAGDYITVESYQFSADIAAVGPYGRGYKRVRYVFDMCDGTPKIIFRQDLSHLGWALGRTVRDTWMLAKGKK